MYYNRLTSIYKSPKLFVKVNEARLSFTVLGQLHRGKGMAAISKKHDELIKDVPTRILLESSHYPRLGQVFDPELRVNIE